MYFTRTQFLAIFILFILWTFAAFQQVSSVTSIEIIVHRDALGWEK